jgi:hypothetical protein
MGRRSRKRQRKGIQAAPRPEKSPQAAREPRRNRDRFSSGLPGFQLKVNWARKHLKTLKDAERGWLHVNTDAIWEELDPQTGDTVIYTEPRPIPDGIGLIASDCIHSLRSALDQLVYALAWKHTAGPMRHATVTNSEFPIYGPRAPYASESAKRIGAIHPDAQAVIQRLQPHLRVNTYASDELWILDQLWNIDKHRRLPFMAAAVDISTVIGRGSGTIEMHTLTVSGGGPISRKTELMRWDRVGPNHTVDMKRSFDREIALGKGTPAPGEPIVPLLTRLADYVEDDVLRQLAPFLD